MGCGGSAEGSKSKSRVPPPVSVAPISTQTDPLVEEEASPEKKKQTDEILPAKEEVGASPSPKKGDASPIKVDPVGVVAEDLVKDPIKRMVVVSSRKWKVGVTSQSGYPSQVAIFDSWGHKLDATGVKVALKSVQDLLIQVPTRSGKGKDSNPLAGKSGKTDDDDEEEEEVSDDEPSPPPPTGEYLWVDDSHVETLGLIVLEYTPCSEAQGGPQLHQLRWSQLHSLVEEILSRFQVASLEELEAARTASISAAAATTTPQKQAKPGTPAADRRHSGKRMSLVLSPGLAPGPHQFASPAKSDCKSVTSGGQTEEVTADGADDEGSSFVTSDDEDQQPSIVGEETMMKQAEAKAEAAQWKLIDTMWNPSFREGRLALMEQHLSSTTTTKKSSKMTTAAEGWCTVNLSVVPTPKSGSGLPEEGDREQGKFLAFYFTPSVVLPVPVQEQMVKEAGDSDTGQPMDQLVADCHKRWSVRLEFLSAKVLESNNEGDGVEDADPLTVSSVIRTCNATWNGRSEIFEVVLAIEDLKTLVVPTEAGGVDSSAIAACVRGEHRWSIVDVAEDTDAPIFQSEPHAWIVQVGLLQVPGTVAKKEQDSDKEKASHTSLARWVEPVEKAELSSLERHVAGVLVPGISMEETRRIRKRLKETRRQARRSRINSTVQGDLHPPTAMEVVTMDRGMLLPEEDKINAQFPEFAGRVKLLTPQTKDDEHEEKVALTSARLARCPVLSPGSQALRVEVRFVGAASDGVFPVPHSTGPRFNVQNRFAVNFHYRFTSVQQHQQASSGDNHRPWHTKTLDAVPTEEEFGFISKVSKTVYRSYVGFLSLSNENQKADPAPSSAGVVELIEDGLLDYHYTLCGQPGGDSDGGQEISLGFVSGAGDATSAFDISAAPERYDPAEVKTRALYLLGAAYPDAQVQGALIEA